MRNYCNLIGLEQWYFSLIWNAYMWKLHPKDSKFFDSTNKKVIGKFKDEPAGIPIVEFIGPRSKMYSYVKDNGNNEKTAKGVRKYVIKKNITHENYKDCLLNRKQMLHSMRIIRSEWDWQLPIE